MFFTCLKHFGMIWLQWRSPYTQHAALIELLYAINRNFSLSGKKNNLWILLKWQKVCFLPTKRSVAAKERGYSFILKWLPKWPLSCINTASGASLPSWALTFWHMKSLRRHKNCRSPTKMLLHFNLHVSSLKLCHAVMTRTSNKVQLALLKS